MLSKQKKKRLNKFIQRPIFFPNNSSLLYKNKRLRKFLKKSRYLIMRKKQEEKMTEKEKKERLTRTVFVVNVPIAIKKK